MLVDINLLPQKERDRPAVLIAAVAILLLAIIIWAVFAMMSRAEANEQQALQVQAQGVMAEQAQIRSELEARQGMNEEQQLQATVEWAESYQFDTIPLLEELVSLLPARGFFQTFSYTGLDQAQLVVQFDSSREAAYYLAQLKSSELLTSATLDNVATETFDEAEEEEIIVDPSKPRYLATYTLLFQDERIPVEGEEAEGEAVDEAAPTDGPAEQPADSTETEETDVEVDVDVETDDAESGDESA
ncbi:MULTISPECIES: PilN domain-containing protein [unclassified Planococcus (in: firmicutes)]|uniref:PilN domain-containing protein n=1 Tax=unclassified Planococcus (in: firmicutes) TaxID=2662419 RepID=UPI000C3246CE|nr:MULTISPECIES: fimbrial assembly protein [unclassified Planococcus (in: firmicutes)]AUD13679.1 fimbrial assembly protein [Planococcus sp. MB-3u-03]PKG45858.1 fimbrial assembly protein [Planococcus sp. Urea-trap-24]PKG88433.1 fimbrial assembly protein [Planococcus sp. Urea-3u-39]PKH38849.1 fimbrial assembly protein [Planococcus sp. MB-3u-09]